MINFGGLYSPLDASSGMLADLYPFIQNDASFERQELYYNILASFQVGDSLYVLVPDYRIDSYATVNSELSGLTRMDMAQLINAYNTLDEKSILFPGETKKAVFGMLCYGNLENYVKMRKRLKKLFATLNLAWPQILTCMASSWKRRITCLMMTGM